MPYLHEGDSGVTKKQVTKVTDPIVVVVCFPQGLWTNSSFNRREATLDRHLGTYSNLQGGWARVGPSTYDAIHSDGEWVPSWIIHSYEPATLRSLYDHPNVNPRYTNVPIENIPQNMDAVIR